MLLKIILLISPFAISLSASAITFNLLGLGTIDSNPFTITHEGITMTIGTSRGELVSSPTRFGVDGDLPDDIPDLLEYGETLSIYWSERVYVDRIFISQFDAVDAGIFAVNQGFSGSSAFDLHDGNNNLNGASVQGSNFLYIFGDNTSFVGHGFSLDAIEVRPVPEPGMLSVVAIALTITFMSSRSCTPKRQL